MSIAKLLYWWADYNLGYLLSIRPAITRSSLVAFDRYYYDLEVDPRRYRYGGLNSFIRVIGMFIPRPDLIVILDVPASVAQQRKSEVPPHETARQRRHYLELAERLENAHVVDASQPLDLVSKSVARLILGHLEQRLLNRHVEQQ
jgi:thymidylate kinase